MSRHAPWQLLPAILIYAASALEVIIMVTPFAAYFYSVYSPVIDILTYSEATAWLPQFFLPHLAQSKNRLFLVISYVGPPVAAIGLLGFFACAGQLYYGKFITKKLVNSGLYGRVRHPQYLCLAVSGFGFLLMWPRFFILFTYLMMLGLYYVLSRHEEEIVREKYGKDSEKYMARIPMFNPFRGPFRARGWKPPGRAKAFSVWGVVSMVSILLALLLRQEAASQLYAVRWTSPNITAISLAPRSAESVVTIMEAVAGNEQVRGLIEQQAGISLLFQIATGRTEAEHLLTDLGMKVGAIAMTQLPDTGEFVAVSYLSAEGQKVDPFGLSTRVNPLLLVQPRGRQTAELDARAFVAEQFHPGFYRIMF